MTLPPLAFVMIRHVTSKITDWYWKESYTSIRAFYPTAPILIVDDSSNPLYLREDIVMTHCTVVYDTEHKGCAELLPYYYFHRLRPAQRAVILHDSVFLHQPLELSWSGETGIQFLWSIPHQYDDSIQGEIHTLIDALPEHEKEHIRSMYHHTKLDWTGAFGVMSVIDGKWLDEVAKRFGFMERWMPLLTTREYRCAMERVFGVMAYYHQPLRVQSSMFGMIQSSIPWGTTFVEYMNQYETFFNAHPVMKVWSGR
jgi:hypothetical protein